jgi:hypothetical protein
MCLYMFVVQNLKEDTEWMQKITIYGTSLFEDLLFSL